MIRAILLESWRVVRRAPGPAVACAITIAIALLLPDALALLATNYRTLHARAVGDARVVAFLNRNASAADADALVALGSAQPGVVAARHVPPEEVAAWMARQFDELGDVGAAGASELFPRIVELSVAGSVDAASRERIAALMADHPAVEEVDSGARTLGRLDAVATAVRRVGLGAAIFLGLVALFVVSITVRLAIHARREDIEVMRLVGATRTFIRTPFVIQGAVLGLAGAAASIAVLFLAFRLLLGAGLLHLPFGTLEMSFLDAANVGLLCAAGAVLGLVGSRLGVARHLREA